MKRVVFFAILAGLSGCSNAPIAGLLDCVLPSKPCEPPRTPVGPGGGGDRIPPPELGPPTGPIVPKIG
jgi:hypothetical protein